MCDSDPDNLGLDISHLKKLIEEHKPSSLILVHVLGVPNNMEEINELCENNGIFLLEDTCESVGSKYDDKKLGSFGHMSSFSFYYGHHLSTIEGGMVCTNDDDFYHLLLSIRSHGWDRDLPDYKKNELRKKYNVSDFRALYTFYNPGFNLRSTDLQAFIGINQMDNIDENIKIRERNFNLYNTLIKDTVWKIKPPEKSYVSNMAYPLITDKIDLLVDSLEKNNIECRPLICGSMNEQPFWYERFGKKELPNAKKVHEKGLYIPNHQELTRDEIVFISEVINSII
jgi:CDP-6-deoxy-D-xylo-4-hexulose-3-dehydrase